jgi:putative cell wall-binding protein
MKIQRLSCVALTIAALLTVATPALARAAISPAASTGSVVRLAGADRYGTAVAVSATYRAGVPAVYIATGTGYADAVSAGAAAGSTSPVLLVDGATASRAVVAEVTRLHPGKIILVGGAAVLPDSIGAQLGRLALDGWQRLAGPDRYATAAAVSAATFAPGVPVAYIASGVTFPDALTGSALGALNGGPLLLTDPNTLPSSVATELARLRPGRVVLVGGVGDVSLGVAAAVAAKVSNVSRAPGDSWSATNVAAYSPSPVQSPATVIVATGTNYPDALAGSALAAHDDTVLLLVSGDLTAAQIAFLSTLHAGSVTVIGGPAAVTDALAITVLNASGSDPRNEACPALSWVTSGDATTAQLAVIQSAVAAVSIASGQGYWYGGATDFVPTTSNLTGGRANVVIDVSSRDGSTLLQIDGTGDMGYTLWTSSSPPFSAMALLDTMPSSALMALTLHELMLSRHIVEVPDPDGLLGHMVDPTMTTYPAQDVAMLAATGCL